MLDHLVLPVGNLAASVRFYSAVLAPLGCVPKAYDHGAVEFLRDQRDTSFWIREADGELGPETHIAFAARSEDEVRGFHLVAVDFGATSLREPQYFPQYHEHYFAAYVRDPDGNNIEAVNQSNPRGT
jgi:catechol 2,3-dioxygenase-like lactoylglutathione lyase family enzyme